MHRPCDALPAASRVLQHQAAILDIAYKNQECSIFLSIVFTRINNQPIEKHKNIRTKNIMAVKRKRFSNVDKLAIAQKALQPGSTITSVARAKGLNESSVQGWVKNIQKLEESVIEINSGKLKATQR